MQAVMVQPETAIPSRHEVWKMFDRIAGRYDLLNRLLSFGQDVGWRRRLADFLPTADHQQALDLATGTGDQILALVGQCPRIEKAVGLDMAEKMLEIGRTKIARRKLDRIIQLQTGDAERIPFPDDTFHVVTISFGIRNVTDTRRGLREIHRVLRRGGRALILEFSLPRARWFRGMYLIYFRHVLPRLGGLISGDAQAYRYLNRTVETFPYGQNFCDLLSSAGFVAVLQHPMTFGIATIYSADKPYAQDPG